VGEGVAQPAEDATAVVVIVAMVMTMTVAAVMIAAAAVVVVSFVPVGVVGIVVPIHLASRVSE
jgi:hypothetical protein